MGDFDGLWRGTVWGDLIKGQMSKHRNDKSKMIHWNYSQLFVLFGFSENFIFRNYACNQFFIDDWSKIPEMSCDKLIPSENTWVHRQQSLWLTEILREASKLTTSNATAQERSLHKSKVRENTSFSQWTIRKWRHKLEGKSPIESVTKVDMWRGTDRWITSPPQLFSSYPWNFDIRKTTHF